MDFDEMRGAYLRATQDGIVTRLRIPLPYNLLGWTTTDLMNERREAADEIERLRMENRELRSEVQRLTVAAY